MTRRLMAGLCGVASLGAVAATAGAAPSAGKGEIVEIRLRASADRHHMSFDPIGIRIRPGQTVRWIQVTDYHSVAAYHPANGSHELRIPTGAKPWDSDVMLGQYPAKGSTFEHTFTQEGVYDYFCGPHEQAGMVGRIIVGQPGSGPGTLPFNYAPGKGWKPVPSAAQAQFPTVAEIMAKGRVPARFP
jgi:plastocyanin